MLKFLTALVFILLVFSLLVGCSEKLVYIEPNYPTLQTYDVNMSDINITYEVTDENV